LGVKESRRCIALLGGSFDPVHNGHVALGSYFAKLLFPDELHIIPAGNPWQKDGLIATAQQRVDMLHCAFDQQALPVHIDLREIQREGATYTIDTLRAMRTEAGPETSIVFLIGADQLQRLDTWKDWQQLFDYTHVCAASRPGFAMDDTHVPAAVAREFTRRAASPEQIRGAPHGLTYFAANLCVDISSSQVRAMLGRGEQPDSLIPAAVLDYIKLHHLYRN
jgi:nicotinate-nucleotide adenylyltransferase